MLELDNRQTCFTNEQVNESKEKYRLKNQPYGAILCTKPVRRLEVKQFFLLELFLSKNITYNCKNLFIVRYFHSEMTTETWF